MPILPHPHFTENLEKQAKRARKSHSKNIWAYINCTLWQTFYYVNIYE